MTIIEERVAKIDAMTLDKGAHDEGDEMCVMEAVAYVAGEPWSDHPECACPVIGAFMQNWNDSLDDETRQRLKPYVTRLVGTKSTTEVEVARSWMACDWLVRTFTPAWLELAGLGDDAAALRGLPNLDSAALVDAAMPVIEKAHKSAAAARAAARDAAWAAAWAAAGAAAWDAAWAAAGAAAGAAARDAAWAAARDAARDAARAALAPTVLALQGEAFGLLDRMLAVTPESVG